IVVEGGGYLIAACVYRSCYGRTVLTVTHGKDIQVWRVGGDDCILRLAVEGLIQVAQGDSRLNLTDVKRSVRARGWIIVCISRLRSAHHDGTRTVERQDIA